MIQYLSLIIVTADRLRPIGRLKRSRTNDETATPRSGEGVDWLGVLGAPCLEYPGDPPRLRWSWDKDFDTYLQMVQRHLFAEELTRRDGACPVKDTPHGCRPDGNPRPLTTLRTLAA